MNLKMKKLKEKLFLGCFAIIALTIISCDENDDGNLDLNTTNIEVSSDATLGTILVDVNGNSLYFFAKDTKDTSQCMVIMFVDK